MNKTDNKMRKFYFTIIALMATLVASAQTIKVYEYNENGELSTTPSYISSKKVKVVFADDAHEYVDLALPSGTLWATCNVGAEKPEEYGDYFAWGETKPKDTYEWSTYKWCNGSYKTITKYCTNNAYGTYDNKKELLSEDDAATANWGSDWCMPTYEQQNELINSSYTTTEWTTQNGVWGWNIISKKNGKNIFLPAAGLRYGDSLNFAGTLATFWSRTLLTSTLLNSLEGCYIFFCSDFEWFNGSRCYGQSVRPVRCKKIR